ncbi:ribonuclease III [Fulvivirga maritima]|uniref:ribonuclease III n=1 Tax=Fulvivirga maritima TaxID=2904247 RepID=UPI001F19965A|nr:ribonuclease III [Fulvivirga maritima]UII29437.1 ribonuclease III [Fulvivirga maritima]
MHRGVSRLVNIFRKRTKKDKRLITAIKTIVGSKPFNLKLYQLAIKHSSMARVNSRGLKESNERLEYLGDAVLGAIVADYLFKTFPFKDEGFLTEIRSRIVNRESLNTLGKKIGLNQLVEYDQNKKNALSHKSLYGDTLEALVGAVYLDKGYRFCSKFVLEKLIIPYFDINEIIRSNPNWKSKIIEWSQKENKELKFEIIGVKAEKQHREFTAQVYIDDEPMATGVGASKKKAEQNAAQKTCEILKLE